MEPNGVLRTNIELDREVVSRYSLQISAADRGQPVLTGTATVEILVIDKVKFLQIRWKILEKFRPRVFGQV